MCAIIGSISKTKLNTLFELNSYRGELSWSLATFNSDFNLKAINRAPGRMSATNLIDQPVDFYYIGHTQAPTTQTNNIHPASYKSALLWHNGIIKQKEIKNGEWDTEYLLARIVDEGFEVLSEINGTFACVMYMNGALYVFRNEISPLFYTSDGDLSSTKFENSKLLPAGQVFKFTFDDKIELIATHHKFKTKENPYFLGL